MLKTLTYKHRQNYVDIASLNTLGSENMDPHRKFKFSSIDDLRTALNDMGIFLPLSDNIDILKQPLNIYKKRIPNRMITHPMEGVDGDAQGRPRELTRRRYIRFAEGGAGLIWFEATAVVNEGRANPRQLLLTRETATDIRALLQNTLKVSKNIYGSDCQPYTVLQLTHSGRYSNPSSKPHPIVAATNPFLDPKTPATKRIITDDELEELEDRFVEAALLASEIGFDAVDIKSCHRYLISELLSAYTREGLYGGSFENRTRLLINVIDKIRAQPACEVDVAVRMNAHDSIPHPYGWGVNEDNYRQVEISEPIRLAKLLRDRGVELINISAGNPYYNPHVGRPYDFGPYVPKENQLYSVERMLGLARDIQAAVPETAIVATGFSWLREFGAVCAAGGLREGWFQLAGFGRQAFAYPDFAKDIMDYGKMDRKKCCIACGKCTELMRLGGGCGCVIQDAEVYRPIYKKLKEGQPSMVGKEVAEHV
jgi:2,4-dienoyl-CoA reductase-like NADH-dependent reductase (Old Yellow Enzyme family)